jgi:hypothetical protein
MSGQRIDDHASWLGGKPKGSVFPEGVKKKEYQSAEGAGHLGSEYPDTSEDIQRDQMKGDAKAKAHPIKPGYRN